MKNFPFHLRMRGLRTLALLPMFLLTACAVQQAAPPAPAPAPGAPTVASQPALTQAQPVEAAPPDDKPRPLSFDKIVTLRDWVAQQQRLYRVAAPLLIKNTQLCPRHRRNLLGLTARTKYSYGSDFTPEAAAALGLDNNLRVMTLMPGSGAESAGVRHKDVLAAVGNAPLPTGPDAEQKSAALVSLKMRNHSTLHTALRREGKPFTLDIPLTPACAMGVEVGNSDNVTSYADGYRILVTRGMLKFVQSDQELAYVLAKGMAHNILTEPARQDIGAVIDRLMAPGKAVNSPGLDAGIEPYSPVADATADKLALYLLARAGYDIDGALPFWKRLASAYSAETPASYTALHPFSSYRFSVMSAITRVIALKIKKKLPLLP